MNQPRGDPARPDPRLACPICDAHMWTTEVDDRFVRCSVCGTITLASNCKEVDE